MKYDSASICPEDGILQSLNKSRLIQTEERTASFPLRLHPVHISEASEWIAS